MKKNVSIPRFSESVTHDEFYENLCENVLKSPLSEVDKQKVLRGISRAKKQSLGIALAGPTGAGKTSTICALVGAERVENAIGTGTMPETQSIEEYSFQGLRLFDTPGLGDGVEADRRHAEEIHELLQRTDDKGKPIVDLVLIILDGSSRDLGTTIDLINELLIYHFKDDPDRVLIAINKADRSIPVGNHWDYETNQPDDAIKIRMEEMCDTISDRVYDSTGISVEPIWFVAGGKEAGDEKKYPAFNISKLLSYIVAATPKKQRAVFFGNINPEPKDYIYDDGEREYNQETSGMLFDSCLNCGSIAAGFGGTVGGLLFGPIGAAGGALICGGLGALGRWLAS